MIAGEGISTAGAPPNHPPLNNNPLIITIYITYTREFYFLLHSGMSDKYEVRYEGMKFNKSKLKDPITSLSQEREGE